MVYTYVRSYATSEAQYYDLDIIVVLHVPLQENLLLIILMKADIHAIKDDGYCDCKVLVDL